METINTKKKVLIVSHAMEIGGAEKSLLGLLESWDAEKYDIDLFLLRHEGELIQYIPENVNLLPEVASYTVLARPMKQTLKEGHLLLTACRLIGKLTAKKYDKKHGYTCSDVALEYSHKYTKRWMPDINPDVMYDLAISFLTPHYFVAEKVKAKKKLAWIHTDYSKIKVNIESELKMWDAYDYIASISESVTESFLAAFPLLKSKICLIENIMPENLIKSQALMESNANKEMSEGEYKILSIGRFCTAKNFDNVPDICRYLRSFGMDVHWYLIGFGPDENLIRKQVQSSYMEEYIHILGKKDNPYPYINQCDLYVQPSRYEGKCVSVREAQMLAKPVAITSYATAPSQLEDGIDGIIVPMENEACAAALYDILRSSETMLKLSDACRHRYYSGVEQIDKIYQIIENNEDKNNYMS